MKLPLRQAVSTLAFLLIAILGGTTIFAQDSTASATGTPTANDTGPWVSSLGLGIYFNEGYGTNGYSVVPGFTLRLDRFPIGLHLGRSTDTLDFAFNVDWLAIGADIPGTTLSWFAGPGVYAGFGLNSGAPASFASGVRGVLGGRILLFDRFEAYVSLVPAFGIGYLDGRQTWLWNIDQEFGLRYVIPMKPKRPEAPRLTHVAVIPVPAPAASQPPIIAVIPDIAPAIESIPEPLAVPLLLADSEGTEAEPTLTPVILDTNGPILTASLPDGFVLTPESGGSSESLTLAIQVLSVSPIDFWNFEIYDPTGNIFYQLEGTGSIPDTLTWDGKAANGELVQSAQTYGFRLSATDSLSRFGQTTGEIHTGILLSKSDEGFKLDLSSLVFRSNLADLVDDDSEAGKANAGILSQLVSIFGQYPQHRIVIIGHAMNISGTQDEEEEVKLLSLARAETAKRLLVDLGIDTNRVSTQGMGSAQPLVPDTDTANNWKNRRVEILLINN